MKFGHIVKAEPIMENDEMKIIVEMAVTKEETQTIVFKFDELDDFMEALLYWALLMKGHEMGLLAAENREKFESLLANASLESMDIEELNKTNRVSKEQEQSPDFNPLFRAPHAAK